jgi:hypothetical protein
VDIAALFSVCNFGVLPFWLLLVFAPKSAVTQALVFRPVVPVVFGIVYGVLIFGASDVAADANMGSLAGVQGLFDSPWVTTAGWIHYLIFDLFVGAWETRDAARRGIPHWMVVPCLVLTLMLGPIGLLAYLLLRWLKTRVVALDELSGLGS